MTDNVANYGLGYTEEKGGDFENASPGIYKIGVPVFDQTKVHTSETGTFVVGEAPIVEAPDGASERAALAIFLRDPTASLENYGALHALFARHGCSPSGMALTSFNDLMAQANRLLSEAGHEAWVVVNDGGYVENFKVSPDQEVLAVFHSFDLWDFERGRFTVLPRESEYKGVKRMQYLAPVMARVINGKFKDTLLRYRFLNMTMTAKVQDMPGGRKQLTLASTTGQSGQTNWMKTLQAFGVDLEALVCDPDNADFLKERLLEALDNDALGKRPEILELIQDAALKAVEEGQVVKCSIVPGKGWWKGNATVPATPRDFQAFGVKDVNPLVMLDDLISGGSINTGDKAVELLPQSYAAGMYNQFSATYFDGHSVYTEHPDADPTLMDDADGFSPKGVMIKYILPILNWENGKIGVTRQSPCEMTQAQFEIVNTILTSKTYHDLVDSGDAAMVNEFIAAMYAEVTATGSTKQEADTEQDMEDEKMLQGF